MVFTSNNRISGLDQECNASSVFSFVVAGGSKTKEPSNKRKLCFQSKVMREFFEMAELYAASSASVLITGESGTGKELFSRLIHEKSQRNQRNLVAVNCAAIPEQLMESELFGHEKGSFTGAINSHEGYFQRADGGTLLLDEICEISIEMQAKLLRVIEEQELQRIGCAQVKPIDVRIVATANKDLSTEIAQGRFRSDLFHRLSVLELNIPPLRQRVADIPLLVMHFVDMYKSEARAGITQVTKNAVNLLCRYPWPGNVRELRNVIHRACILSKEGEINETSLPPKIVDPHRNDHRNSGNPTFEGMQLAEVEKSVILACLKRFNGSKKLAAAELGVTPRTLSNKMKTYGECA